VKIGNIISKTPINVDKVFNVVESFDDTIEGIPTLIHGFYIVKEKYGSNVNFVERELGENLFWTFTVDEQRKYHHQDIDKFKDYCFENAVSKVNYVFVDPIQFNKTKMKKVLRKMYSLQNPITYILHDKMVYVFGENLIFGIDLKLLKFLGIKDTKIKSRLKSMSAVFLDQNEILIEYKNYLERLDDQAKYIPFLYSISNNE
jgi:hypothetical protein